MSQYYGWGYLCLFVLLLTLSCESFLLPPTWHWRSRYASLALTTNDDFSLSFHHTAVKTRNITLAIQFYSLLGFKPSVKFRAGPARAAWLEQHDAFGRLELIEVPSYMLNEQQGTTRRAIDLIKQQELLGQNHLALDVTSLLRELGLGSLAKWMDFLNERSMATFGKNLRIALPPRQQLIGNKVYELAFLYDADGALVEILHEQKELPQNISSGWDPLDGPSLTIP